MQKQLRLARKEDFKKVYSQGKSTANHQFVVYCLKQPAIERFRLGVSVSKKVGKAVVRNRIRRLVKEIIRNHQGDIANGFDLVIIARKPAADMEYGEMKKSLIHLLKRASLWSKENPRPNQDGNRPH